MSLDILITGGAGQVGLELQAFAWPAHIQIHAPTREALDITNAASVDRFFAGKSFDAVINPAAYTAVDRAESDVVAAWEGNALAPAILATETARRGIPLIHVSTDYVFDGTKPMSYVETDPVAPIGVYGASKEGGEQAVRTANPRHVIVRTAWVVSPHRSNFLKTMLRVGAERPLLKVVDDQHGCPTSAHDLAAVLAAIALRHLEDEQAPTGTYHAVNAGETTWCGFAREIFAQSAKHGGSAPQVEAIRTEDYPTPAKRPANSRLSTEKLKKDFGLTLPSWQEATADIVGRLMSGEA